MRFIKQSVIFLLSTVLFVACSGSSGESGPSTPLPSGMAKIDASTAAPIAQGTIEVVFSSGKFADILLGVSAPVPGTTTPCVADGSVIVSGQIADLSTLSAGDRILLQFADCDDGAGQVFPSGPTARVQLADLGGKRAKALERATQQQYRRARVMLAAGIGLVV